MNEWFIHSFIRLVSSIGIYASISLEKVIVVTVLIQLCVQNFLKIFKKCFLGTKTYVVGSNLQVHTDVLLGSRWLNDSKIGLK